MESHQDGMTALIDAIGISPPLPLKPGKSSDTATTPGQSGIVHQCRLCGRVYERPDHLNRHLKSHENARPFKCLRCPKSFNRADLLTRHVAGHKRQDENGGLGRKRIERSDRVAEACLACVASKSKCQDEKPCSRCLKKNIACTTASGSLRGSSRGTKAQSSNADGSAQLEWSPSPTDTTMIDRSAVDYDGSGDGANIHGNQSSPSTTARHFPPDSMPFNSSSVDYNNVSSLQRNYEVMNDGSNGVSYPTRQPDTNQLLEFSPRNDYFTQDFDFGIWDVDLEGIEFIYQSTGDRGSQSTGSDNRHRSSEPSISHRAISRRYAAFERSPWLWNPTQEDHSMNDHADIAVDEEAIPSVLTLELHSASTAADFSRCFIDSKCRDKLLSLLFTLRRNPDQFPSFPSLSLLNNLIKVYFTQESYRVDQLIHIGTFNAKDTTPQLLMAIISAGCSFISIPAVWKMGLALQEVTRIATRNFWEQNNIHTRDLAALQAYMIALDVGLWSGFKRKMEIAESFGQSLTVMLRRAGAFAATRNELALTPNIEDSQSTLESKWRTWVQSESYKRLVLFLFMHGVQASFSLQNPSQISVTELKLSLPASRSLWLARTAVEWRDRYLQEGQISTSTPSFISAMQNPDILYMFSSRVDVSLCNLALLHGFWGQISHLHESKKFYLESKATHRLCLLTEQGDLYRDLQEFSEKISSFKKYSTRDALISELFMMSLHVSPEDLQRFAGKHGEAEATLALEEFNTWWASNDARIAIWHAGRVFKLAQRLRPAQLTGFNAIAVYYACLTLWIYGLMMPNDERDHENHTDNQKVQRWVASSNEPSIPNLNGQKQFPNSPLPQIVLNELETAQIRTFKHNGEGIPGLNIPNRANENKAEFVPLYNTIRILSIGRDIYRQNFPVVDEPLPPLVANLSALLRDLESTTGSAAPSQAASESLDAYT
ncbi:hypothetical protein F5884DRAFT_850067 [Xylogone sp. PMI_703]|nr:hypothetical protein F5884DRAFT_850067 [Xylogone sp. PMI_703]